MRSISASGLPRPEQAHADRAVPLRRLFPKLRQHSRAQRFELGGMDGVGHRLRAAAGHGVEVLAGRALLGAIGFLGVRQHGSEQQAEQDR
jgi:hypothetical protein